jgi:hypothetical protein
VNNAQLVERVWTTRLVQCVMHIDDMRIMFSLQLNNGPYQINDTIYTKAPKLESNVMSRPYVTRDLTNMLVKLYN